MPSAIASIHVPMFETNAPVHSRAYAGCRSGANEIRRSARRGSASRLGYYALRHCGLPLLEERAHALVRVVGLRVVDHDRAREVVGGALGESVLRVERALAEREHGRARRRDACPRARRPRRRASAAGTTRFTRPHSAAVARVDHLAGEQHLERALAPDRAARRAPSASSRTARCSRPASRSGRRRPRSRGRTRRRAGSRPRSRRRAPWRSPAAGSCAAASSARRRWRTAPRRTSASRVATISARSWPAEKAGPRPSITSTRVAASAATSSSAASISSISASESALRRSGRLSTSRVTGEPDSSEMCSKLIDQAS